MKKRAILFSISFGLLAALIYFSDPSRVLSTFFRVDLNYLFLVFFLWFVSLVVRSYRWQFLLKRSGINIPFLKTTKYYITGIFISNLSPAKTGEPARAAFVKKLQDESFSKSLGSIFAERIFDTLSMIFLAVIGLLLLVPSSQVFLWVYGAIFLYLALIVLAIYLTFSEGKLEVTLTKIISIFSFIPKVDNLKNDVEKFTGKFRSSLSNYTSRWTMFVTFLLSVSSWIVNTFKGMALFLAFGIYAPFTVVMTVTCVGILVSVLTFLPGSLGSGEIIRVTLFSLFLTIPVSHLTSVVILGRLTGFWIYAVLGAVLFSTFQEKALDLGL